LAGLDELGQELALAQEMTLAVETVEGLGPHPLGQGDVLFLRFLGHGSEKLIIAEKPGVC
jgi:hypothetical protein